MQDKYPKILLLAGWYPHSLNSSEGDFIKYQAKLMADAGVNLDVLHSNMTYKYWLNGRFIKRKYVDQSNGFLEVVTERPFIPRNNVFGMSQWARFFLKDYDQYVISNSAPDLIHAHTYLGGYIASKINKKTGIPYIVTLHETSLLEEKIPAYHTRLLGESLDNAEEVITVSSGLKKKVKEAYGIEAKVLNNFIDFDLFGGKIERPKEFTYVFVGDLIQRKNVHLLLESFAALRQKEPNVQLKIIGDGSEMKSLRRRAETLQLGKNVSFLGRLSQKEVSEELLKSSCLVNPSITETFGIVFVEALSCGLPIISTPSVGPSDIINDRCGILLSSFSKEELTAAMDTIYVNSTHYNPTELRAYAKEKFSSDIIINKYKDLYNKILKQVKK